MYNFNEEIKHYIKNNLEMFRLVVITVDGSKKEYHYEDFDELEYNATFCQFSPNVAKAYGQEWFFSGWKTLFTIGK